MREEAATAVFEVRFKEPGHQGLVAIEHGAPDISVLPEILAGKLLVVEMDDAHEAGQVVELFQEVPEPPVSAEPVYKAVNFAVKADFGLDERFPPGARTGFDKRLDFPERLAGEAWQGLPGGVDLQAQPEIQISSISRGLISRANAPRRGKNSIIPSAARRWSASRTGVRDTPSAAEIPSSESFSPGAIS